MTKPLRAVLFDFDGTLADSYEAIAASVNHVRQSHGLPPLPTPEVTRFVGKGPEYLLRHTIPGCDVAEAWDRYRQHHPSVMFAQTTLLPGAREAAERLYAADVRLGICSNKPRLFTRKLVEHLQLGHLFAAVVGPEDVPRPKPAPDMLLAALKMLGVTAGEALYVGDMGVDIETARAAGVRVWVVPTGSDTREALEAMQPDRLLEDLGGLPAALGI